MKSQIVLNDVSLKFKIYNNGGVTLKETLLNKILKKNYETKKEFLALNNINLEINAGDRIGIIGNNGAGKSTLLKLIAKIYHPTSGEVKVKGNVAPLIELGAGFNPELSGYENIFLNGAIMGIPKKQMKTYVDDIIEFSDLKDFIHTPIKYYSSGMYMRLAFTIATEISPDILIIDELFAGGDITFIDKAEKRIMSLIDNSQIVIMVSHGMDLVEKLCNKVILLEHGNIIKVGEPKEMIQFYKDRYGILSE